MAPCGPNDLFLGNDKIWSQITYKTSQPCIHARRRQVNHAEDKTIMQKCKKKTAIPKPRIEASEENNFTYAVIMDLQSSKVQETYFYCSVSKPTYLVIKTLAND